MEEAIHSRLFFFDKILFANVIGAHKFNPVGLSCSIGRLSMAARNASIANAVQ